MRNLIYYDKSKFDIYFRKISKKYAKANKSEIYIKDIDKFNIRNSIVTFEVKDFLIKPLDMPLDNYINDRVLNSVKFYFNNHNDDVLYDYFLLDSDVNIGQVKILLYAMKIQSDVQKILNYIDKSYLVVRPLQFIMLEYISYKFNLSDGILINKIDKNTYNFIVFKKFLILFNEYVNEINPSNIGKYVDEKLSKVREDFKININKNVYFLNDNPSFYPNSYDFNFKFINYTMEEILTKHDYVRSKFSKFWKKRENFKKNA
mgnify:FL=1